MATTLKFLGAAQNVTGSRHLLEAAGRRILVDCGLYQERALLGRNWGEFPVPPRSIDAVLLTHAHLDHCGLLPKLVRDGFRGPIYATAATAEIARFVLEDSARIQEEDVAAKRRRHEREGRRGPHPLAPLYSVADAAAAIARFQAVRYDRPLDLGGGATARFINVGHILGAACVHVTVPADGGGTRSVLFSGDVGRWDAPILQDPSPLPAADAVLVESTYGDRLHPAAEECTERLAEVVNSTHRAGGKVVIPTFAVERAQDVLYCINELLRAGRIPRMPVILDSPMAISVTDVFERHPDLYDDEMRAYVRQQRSPFDLPGLRMARSTNDSKAVNDLAGPAVVMAGSGMCTGGRIKHHLARHIGGKANTILFVGYQAAGTLGRLIVEGLDPVRILGEPHPVRARVEQISGLSAHADRDELVRWLGLLPQPPRQVFVVHGEPDAARAFAATVHDRLGWRTAVPDFGAQAAVE
jgi:metallo-beta-lactamase family protein